MHFWLLQPVRQIVRGMQLFTRWKKEQDCAQHPSHCNKRISVPLHLHGVWFSVLTTQQCTSQAVQKYILDARMLHTASKAKTKEHVCTFPFLQSSTVFLWLHGIRLGSRPAQTLNARMRTASEAQTQGHENPSLHRMIDTIVDARHRGSLHPWQTLRCWEENVQIIHSITTEVCGHTPAWYLLHCLDWPSQCLCSDLAQRSSLSALFYSPRPARRCQGSLLSQTVLLRDCIV